MSEIIREANQAIVCPRAGQGTSAIVIDLKAISKNEARICEVQSVTPMKAGELLSIFNISWRDLHRDISYLEKEKNDAERDLTRIRSTLILDKVPGILKEKGLTNNEHHREAVVALDPDYQRAEDILDQIKAIIELLKGKLKSFEMAYTSVKKLLGENAFNFVGRNENLSGTSSADNDRDIGVTDENERPAQIKSGFGTPRY